MIPTVLICGKTGAGKTSLIQALSSSEVVPDDAIGHSEPTTRGVVMYRTPVANFVDCEGMEPGQTTGQYADFIMEKVYDSIERGDVEYVIIGIFYCIDGSGGRIQQADEDLIRSLDSRVNVVLTKADTIREKQFVRMMSQLGDLVPEERIFIVSSCQSQGLTRLNDHICAMAETAMAEANERIEDFRTRWEGYYREKLDRWNQAASDEADASIGQAARRAALLALMPMPMSDLLYQIVNELYMIYRIGNAYGYPLSREAAVNLSKVVGVSLAAKLVTSFLLLFKIAINPWIIRRVGGEVKAHFVAKAKSREKELREKFRAEFMHAELEGRKNRRLENPEPETGPEPEVKPEPEAADEGGIS